MHKKNSASGCKSRNILNHSSTLQDKTFFHSLSYISGRNPAEYFPTFRNCKDKIHNVAHGTQYNGSDSCIVHLQLCICLLLQIGSKSLAASRSLLRCGILCSLLRIQDTVVVAAAPVGVSFHLRISQCLQYNISAHLV